MRVRVNVTGDREAAAVIDRMRRRLERPNGWFKDVAVPLLAENQRKAFATGGASQGSSWDAIKTSTVARRRRGSGYLGTDDVLISTGRLRATMIYPASVHNRKSIKRDASGNTVLRYGVNTTRGQAGSASQGGVGYAWYVSQRRPFARASQQTGEKLTREMRDYLIGWGKARA